MLGVPVGLHEMEKLTRVLRLYCGPFGTNFFWLCAASLKRKSVQMAGLLGR